MSDIKDLFKKKKRCFLVTVMVIDRAVIRYINLPVRSYRYVNYKDILKDTNTSECVILNIIEMSEKEFWEFYG